jgi:hypothetical protein
MCGSVNGKGCLMWASFLGHWQQVHKESYGRSVKHEAYAYCRGERSGGNTGSEHPATSVRQTVVCDMNHYRVYLAYFPRMYCCSWVTGSCVEYKMLCTLLCILLSTAQIITLYLNTQIAGPWTSFFSCNKFIALKYIIQKFINIIIITITATATTMLLLLSSSSRYWYSLGKVDFADWFLKLNMPVICRS